MASKKKFLTDPEIRELASLSSEQLDDRLSSMGASAARDLIKNLISSYRLAARVANAAWRFWEVWKKEAVGPFAAEEVEFQQALHGYAPHNIPQYIGELECLVDELSLLLEEDCDDLDDLREVIRMRFADYARALESQKLPARTPA